jgi:hypothetical protein
LHELLAQLSPEEKKLFDMLDAELERIESFYVMREKETQERSNMLQGQLNELSEHKKVVQVRYWASFHLLISLFDLVMELGRSSKNVRVVVW